LSPRQWEEQTMRNAAHDDRWSSSDSAARRRSAGWTLSLVCGGDGAREWRHKDAAAFRALSTAVGTAVGRKSASHSSATTTPMGSVRRLCGGRVGTARAALFRQGGNYTCRDNGVFDLLPPRGHMLSVWAGRAAVSGGSVHTSVDCATCTPLMCSCDVSLLPYALRSFARASVRAFGASVCCCEC
jgi:hypothetical protein